MLRKSVAYLLLSCLFCISAFAQNAPTERQQSGEKARTMVFTTSFDGSYLGVQTKDVSKENMAQFGLNEVRGVVIEKVLDNSPAANAGLLNGDVIIRFNGEEITSVRKLTRLIGEVAPDHKATVTVLRNGAERSFDVTMGKRDLPQFFDGNYRMENLPPMPRIPAVPALPRGEFPVLKDGDAQGFFWSAGANRQIGISVTSLTKQLGDYFGAAEGKGLLINSVRENSPAAKAGLRAGDIIVEVEGKEVNNNLELIRTINEKKEGNVNLVIIRDRNRQTISVTPEATKPGGFKLDGDLEKLFFENAPPASNLRLTAPLNLEKLIVPGILE